MTDKTSYNKSKLSYRGRRLLALMKGKENIDDFPIEEPITIYNVKRDLVITCTRNNLSEYLEKI